MVLSVIPCADAHAGHSGHNIPGVELTQEQEHTPDHCSPLCICNCCGTVIAMQYSMVLLEIAQFYPETIVRESVYHDSFISAFPGNIWQPPRFSA